MAARWNRPSGVHPVERDPGENENHAADADGSKAETSRRRYQLHLWISAREYTMLKHMASERDEAMTHIVRRLIRQLKRTA